MVYVRIVRIRQCLNVLVLFLLMIDDVVMQPHDERFIVIPHVPVCSRVTRSCSNLLHLTIKGQLLERLCDKLGTILR